jgi:hypothetical protein
MKLPLGVRVGLGFAPYAASRRGDGPDSAQFSANLGRNLVEGRLGALSAVFEAA